MKLLINRHSFDRLASEFAAPPLDYLVAETDGTVTLGGAVLAPDAIKPDIAWLSIEAFRDKQTKLILGTTLEAGSVKWLQICFAGLDRPEFRRIFDQGIRLTNSDAQAIAIAEYVIASVLADWHPVAAQRAAQREHQWRRVPFREIGRSHWLIVGFGKIGQEIAHRMKPFGTTITAVRRNQAPHALADRMARLEDLPQLLPEADVVVLAAGLNDATRDLAGSDFFAAMKPESVLVNIGRGGLVDDAALLAALDRGTPSVAILDVFRTEPLPSDSPFWDHPRVRLTPHSSSGGDGTLGRGDILFLDNLKRFAAGEPLINEVGEGSF